MIRFLAVSAFVILFLVASIPLLIAEWILGKWNPHLKDTSSLAIVKWAFRRCLALAGASWTVLGEERVPKDQAVLYVANHRSYFDILLTYIRVPRPTGYVAKSEMLKAPLLVNWMKNLHCLFLKRSDLRAGMQMIQTGAEEIRRGVSVCIFPEGTRNHDPEHFLPFRGGSFKIAEKAACPIVPIAISGSSGIWEDQFPRMKRAHVVIEYGEPIPTDHLSREERKQLPQLVEERIFAMYQKNRSLI